MSYSTANEEYRQRGIKKQHIELNNFIDRINTIFLTNYKMKISSENEDINDKIDGWMIEKSHRISVDVKMGDRKRLLQPLLLLSTCLECRASSQPPLSVFGRLICNRFKGFLHGFGRVLGRDDGVIRLAVSG